MTDPTQVSVQGPPITTSTIPATDSRFCGANQVVTGMVAKYDGAIDSIDLICTDVNDATAVDPVVVKTLVHTQLSFIAGTADTSNDYSKTEAAPAGYAIVGIETESCSFDNEWVIGRIRPIFKGVERYGMHTISIPGGWIGTACHDPMFSDLNRFVSDHNPLNYAVEQNLCSLTHSRQGGNEWVLTGMSGEAGRHVQALSGYCDQVTPASNAGVPSPRPKLVSWGWTSTGEVAVTQLNQGRYQQVFLADGGPLRGLGFVLPSNSQVQPSDLWPLNLMDLFGVEGGTPSQTFNYSWPQLAGLPVNSQVVSQPSDLTSPYKVQNRNCDTTYVMTGVLGMYQTNDRVTNILGQCQAMDLENYWRTGTALVELYAQNEDFFTHGFGGGKPANELNFYGQCPKGQQMRGFIFERNSDSLGVQNINQIFCDTVTVSSN